MQKHIGLILFYAFRNGQNISPNFFTTINKFFKHSYVSAMKALEFYVDRNGTKDIANINSLIMCLKRKIQEKDQ